MREIASQAQPQGQVGGGQRAGHGDRRRGQLGQRPRPAGDDHRAVAVAHARPARAEHVAVGQMGVGVQADGRQFQLAAEGPAVERLDIDQLVLEAVAAGVDLALGQGVEHEGVVGVGAMAHADEEAVVVHGRPRR